MESQRFSEDLGRPPTYDAAAINPEAIAEAGPVVLTDKALVMRSFLRHLLCTDYRVDQVNNISWNRTKFISLSNAVADVQGLDLMVTSTRRRLFSTQRITQCAVRREVLQKIIDEDIQLPCNGLKLPVEVVKRMLIWYRKSLLGYGLYSGCLHDVSKGKIGVK
ncbi:hypothetical protein Slin14017_G002690 [Septoria linicola]|nr:hypothetical protein Slin14017_G002690 [Septoria linicola]